jgi:hypothetical protein
MNKVKFDHKFKRLVKLPFAVRGPVVFCSTDDLVCGFNLLYLIRKSKLSKERTGSVGFD